MLNRLTRFSLDNKFIFFILFGLITGWGLSTAPFDWAGNLIPRDPVPVDAIPDLGENQQIIEAEWPGRSPQDIENQITYPLTTRLLSVPGVKAVRSTSMLGFSSIFVIFDEEVDFYWSRSRIMENLSSIPENALPEGVKPILGPDATGLGQIFWFTLEGLDENGKSVGGWEPHELRTIADYQVANALTGVQGVSEVATIGGAVKEYQIEINPTALLKYGISILQVADAVKASNRDAGARTIEINKVEYVIRGLGYISSLSDLESIVLKTVNHTPITLNQVAKIQLGPAQQRGYLDKSGELVTGGVVVARYGSNPLQVIRNVKEKIKEISLGLPTKILENGTVSKVSIVPFYDRTGLIQETLATLEDALILQVLVTAIVVILMLMELRSSFVVSALLPLAVLSVFIAMRYSGIDANIVALSGIAIAIGTMVDMGIILTENILYQKSIFPLSNWRDLIFDATKEVGSAILTAVSTTIVSFIPVFTMIGAEGKLFRSLAFTKTYALLASILITLFLLPAFAHLIFGFRLKGNSWKRVLQGIGLVLSFYLMFSGSVLIGLLAGLSVVHFILSEGWPTYPFKQSKLVQSLLAALLVAVVLAKIWMPLGASHSVSTNLFFVIIVIGLLIGVFYIIQHFYEQILNVALNHAKLFLVLPLMVIVAGLSVWIGFSKLVSPLDSLGYEFSKSKPVMWVNSIFPGLGTEFMPSLDEGSFLLMPTILPHGGVEESVNYLQWMDKAVAKIPEVESVVGKMGRANSALDPAPISMFENVILYKTEYIQDKNGRKIKVKQQEDGSYKPDPNGVYVRQWRDKIKTKDDIWDEIVHAIQIPGLTSAPKLQPIETRIVMLQSGMRAPIGIKVKGNHLETIENTALELESVLKGVSSIEPSSVFAERTVGNPYLEIEWDRAKLARFGLSIEDVQQYLELALGGMSVTQTVEGRERYDVRLRYARAFRENPDDIENMMIQTANGANLRLKELAEIRYRKGPQMIRSEDTFMTTYIIFDKKDGIAEVDVINDAQAVLQQHIQSGDIQIPPGVSFEFAGTYENQIRAQKRLSIVLPLSLMLIFLILYLQFRSVSTSVMIFSSIFVAWAGGFLMLWLYAQPWFLNFSWMDVPLRELFHIRTFNLSVAVWVGFIALFGITSDDGVLIATYIKQKQDEDPPQTKKQLRALITDAGLKRIRPALMTSATTILALLPVLTSSGKGSDIMIPMAIPTFGGMFICLITLFVIPVLYYLWNVKKLEE